METWRPVVDYPRYEVSDRGRVRNKVTGYILNPLLNKDDYLYVDVYDKPQKPVHKRIHRLVCDAFIGPNQDMVVNHKDGDKHNNILHNLEWATPEENSRLASKNGLYKTKPVKIVETEELFESVKECAETIGVHPSDISHVLSGFVESVKGLTFERVELKKEKTPFLFEYQMDAVKKMKNGCILNGGVGSGKSRTGLYYYFSQHGGVKETDKHILMTNPKDLYIITTALKRDKVEWEGEMAPFLISKNPEATPYKHKVVVDSWNNIKKYSDVMDAFFIFDEDRVTGNGVWVKSFLKIAKNNEWIILSASPGDTWSDYIPVFIANGFYKNRTEFVRQHVVYSRFSKFPKVDRYIETGRLIRLRRQILIDMDFKRKTVPHHEDVYVNYDISAFKDAGKLRWNPFKNEPIKNAAELCYVWRKIVNSDVSRQVALLEIFEDHPKLVIFYNFDYELEILKSLGWGGAEVAEWNGHEHQPVPTGDTWVYLVQYAAGSEAWNCTTTNTIVFFSQNYSYKTMIQASGRIDRLNTPYTDLYYYHLKTRSGIDLAISRALKEKKSFNETKFVGWAAPATDEKRSA